jgi:hypothetical protein
MSITESEKVCDNCKNLLEIESDITIVTPFCADASTRVRCEKYAIPIVFPSGWSPIRCDFWDAPEPTLEERATAVEERVKKLERLVGNISLDAFVY